METSHGLLWFSSLDDLYNVFGDYLPGKSFLDLGSGDGKVVEFASEYTNRARGVEIEEDLWKKSAVKLQISFGNLFNISICDEEILYYFLKGSKHELELIKKLNDEFHGIVIIYYRRMKEKQVDVFSSFLDAKEIKVYPYVKVYSFINRKQ